MLYILTGSDEFSIHQALDDIKKSIGGGADLDMNTVTLDGRQVTIEEMRSLCETVPFLSSKRLVVVEGLLGRFEESRERKPAKKDGKAHEAFAALLKTIPDFAVVVLIGDEIKSNPLFKEVSGRAEVRVFPMLGGERLAEWVKGRIDAGSSSIAHDALRELIARVGGNLYVMTGEINKLLAFSRGRQIEIADVRSLVSDIQESSIFVLVDAILEYRMAMAENILEDMLERGEAPVYILTMVLRQASLIVRARDLKDRRVPQAEMMSRLNLRDFALRKTLAQAAKYSLPRLKEVYARLLETDLAIKTGRLQGDFALNILIADLARKSG